MTYSEQVLQRYFQAADKPKKKRLIMMMGPPAAGKGAFIGEPPPKYGWKLPKTLVDAEGKPLLTDEDIPEAPEQDESDNHLKAIQHAEAGAHFDDLAAAHKKGKAAFEKALADHWYETKDGERVELGSHVSYDEFPEDFDSFFKKTNKDFYVSMRGWHDDAKESNEVTGKPKERYKDEARHRFDASVSAKMTKANDLLIVDSAGEDIDAQDFEGQINSAKSHGYEVTVIFLHPEEADTDLSNLSRGKVHGKRMVDKEDISNWYENNADALNAIQKAAPHNFVHYRKGPPDPDPKKAAELRQKARDLMNGLGSLKGDDRKAKVHEIVDILYNKSPYKLHQPTSYGLTLHGLPKKLAAGKLSKAVAEMNHEASKRAKDHAPKKSEDEPDAASSKTKSKTEHTAPSKTKAGPKKTTRMDFLRDVGNQKVSNPNPESRDRFPQVKVRSLSWEYQKPYYDRWKSKRAASTRVAGRYMELRMASKGQQWLSAWMRSLAHDLAGIGVEGYEVEAKAGLGPEVLVTIKGAAEDATTARKFRQQAERVMQASIKAHGRSVPGFKTSIHSFDHGADLLVECTVLFP